MPLYEYPVLYFSANADIFDGNNIQHAAAWENYAGNIKGITAPQGFKLDFNAGLRLSVPPGNWHVRIIDGDTETVVLSQDVSAQTLVSMEKFFVAWQVEIFAIDKSRLQPEKIFEHRFAPQNREVNFVFVPDALGERIMLLPYMAEFIKKYGCRGECRIAELFHPILQRYYPEVQVGSLEDSLSADSYAAYNLGAYQNVSSWMPWGARTVPCDLIGQALLGITEPVNRRQFWPLETRRIKGPYVCIAVQSSGAGKCWLYPGGWDKIVAYLHSLGYRVLCIDKDKAAAYDGYTMVMPNAAEDYTGNIPLTERIELLCHADFFIGQSSGLSWLADACGIKTIVISGFTMPYIEFPATGRVINKLVCHGCYCDPEAEWKELNCPKHKGTAREYECAKKISPVQVQRAIDYVRSFENPLPKLF